MGRIFYIMGKSASGKDSIFQMLAADKELNLRTVIMYTTRPKRSSETEGREYFFRDDGFLLQEREAGRVIEWRTYETVFGPWNYFTLDDGQIRLDAFSYLMIGTLESYGKMKAYFEEKGKNVMVPIYIEVEDGERLLRAVKREMCEKEPHYAELCRRFLSDSKDFCRENLDKFEISRIFWNQDLHVCKDEIKAVILEKLKESVIY